MDGSLVDAIACAWPLAGRRLLPLEAAVALKPWFDRDTLQEGFSLLIQGAVGRFVLYRSGVGAVFNDSAAAFLLMPPSDALSQGFVCRDGSCTLCRDNRSSGRRCRHQAAVALLNLRATGESEGFVPVWRFLKSNPWGAIAKYLQQEAEVGPVSFQARKTGTVWRLEGCKENGFSLAASLSSHLAQQLHCFHSSVIRWHGSMPEQDEFGAPARIIRDKIALLTATDTEKRLNAAGSRSMGQQRENSIQTALVRLLALSLPVSRLRIQRGRDGLFSLTAARAGSAAFSLTLPKARTMDLLGGLDLPGPATTRLPPAEPFSVVGFMDKGTGVRVEHFLRLEDGRELSLAGLRGQRYGSYHYMDNEGFLPRSVSPASERLREPKDGAPMLFNVTKQAEAETGFTVPAGDIPAFVDKNRGVLVSGRHRVDPALLSLQVVREPERLELTDFEEKDDWCYIAGFYGLGNQRIDLAELLLARADGRDYIAGRQWLQLRGTALDWFHGLGADRVCPGANGQKDLIRLRRHELLALTGQIREVGIEIREKGPAQRVTRLVRSDDWLTSDDMPPLPDHLRDYQGHGTAWLYHLQQNHLGGILADDMGLGKTHQALTLLQLLCSGSETGHHLVVCPTTVLYHWLDKRNMFFNDLAMSLYYGTGRNLETALEQKVVLTSYGVLRRDIEQLRAVSFDLVLFDEIQNLKNIKTDVHQAALRLNSRATIGLTGTPVENSLAELKGLFDVCLPGLFNGKSFHRQFVRNDSPASRQTLKTLIKPFILRRTRNQVLAELPEVIEDIRVCRLSDDQVGLYRQVVDSATPLVDDLLDGRDEGRHYIGVLAIITRLKQVCDHPCLLLEGSRDRDMYESGKWDLLLELLEECLAGDKKVVVFSQFTRMLDILESYLDARGVEYAALRGHLSPGARQQAIKRFNTDKSCMVCCASLLASGVGIDLTAAQVVVHYDRWWNPAREEQATARVHRMGQKHVVQVIKLVTLGTLEEKIHTLIEGKKALARDILSEDDASVLKRLSREDLAGLIRWPEG